MPEATLTVVGDELEAAMPGGMPPANGIECMFRRTDRAAALRMDAPGTTMAGPTEVVMAEDDLDRAGALLPMP